MHRSLLLIGLSFITTTAIAQVTELVVHAGSGVGFFSGKTAAGTQTAYYEPGASNSGRLYFQPYGKKPGAIVTAGFTAQRITAKKWVWGTDLSIQYMSSVSAIDSVMVDDHTNPVVTYKADGKAQFSAQFISIAPFFGKRITAKRNTWSITGGPEVAFMVHRKSKAEFKSEDYDNSVKHTQMRGVSPPDVDLRFRFSLGWQKYRVQLSADYVKGLRNYYRNYVGGNPEAYSQMINIRIGYVLHSYARIRVKK